MAKFEKTFCSQCGNQFGPGESGFSHCDQHLRKESYEALRTRLYDGDIEAMRELGRRSKVWN